MPKKSGGYNYLAIGNSITIHPIVDYWWAEDGMASSKPENDYFHLISAKLESEYDKKVVSYAYNFAVWEIQKDDRAEMLPLIDAYLNSDLDLITVQLGENVNDLSTYESDLYYLLEYVMEKSPDAKIVVVSDFWEMDGRDEAKTNAVNKADVLLADISEIKGNVDYMCLLGTTVYDEDGGEHIVEHTGVAKHPGDDAMKYIANKVLKELRK